MPPLRFADPSDELLVELFAAAVPPSRLAQRARAAAASFARVAADIGRRRPSCFEPPPVLAVLELLLLALLLLPAFERLPPPNKELRRSSNV